MGLIRFAWTRFMESIIMKFLKRNRKTEIPVAPVNTSRWKYFKESEIAGVNEEIVEALDRAREISGVPYILTSTLRTPKQNAAVKGKTKSRHLVGDAVDILCKTSQDQYAILKGLLTQPVFNEIVIYLNSRHIHAAKDPRQPRPTVSVLMK